MPASKKTTSPKTAAPKSVKKTTPVASRKKTQATTKAEPKVTIEKEPVNETPSTSTTERTFTSNPANLRKVVALIVVLLGIAGLGYLLYKYIVIGRVDNTPITRFQLYSQLEKRYGKDIKEQLITEQLILNEAKNRSVKVTDQEVDAQIKKIEDQQGGKDKLDQILAYQNLTRDELKRQVRFQVLIEKMFGKDVNISDDEINNYIEQNKDQVAQLSAESSDSAKLRQDVADLLKRQKISQSFNQWLQSALQSTRVKR